MNMKEARKRREERMKLKSSMWETKIRKNEGRKKALTRNGKINEGIKRGWFKA